MNLLKQNFFYNNNIKRIVIKSIDIYVYKKFN